MAKGSVHRTVRHVTFMGSILEGRDLQLVIGRSVALAGATLRVSQGEVVAVLGASGSGKSSLLHCLSGILAPTAGEVWFDGERVDALGDDGWSRLRRERLGFVLQLGQLVPELSLRENVALPLRLLGTGRLEASRHGEEWLDRLGIGELAGMRPGEVSGGEMQRAAVARALVHGPSVLLADEPTGALDSANGRLVLDLMVSHAREAGAAVVMATHDPATAAVADRVVRMVDGRST